MNLQQLIRWSFISVLGVALVGCVTEPPLERVFRRAVVKDFGEPGEIFKVIKAPEAVEGLGMQRVIVSAKGRGPGMAAWLITRRPLPEGTVVRLQRVQYWSNELTESSLLVIKEEDATN